MAEHQRFADLVEEVSAGQRGDLRVPAGHGRDGAPSRREGKGGARGAARGDRRRRGRQAGRARRGHARLRRRRWACWSRRCAPRSPRPAPGCWRRCWPAEDGYAGPHAKCGGRPPGRLRGRPGQDRHHGARPGHAVAGPGITARQCGHGFAPRDERARAWPAASLSPGLAEMIALAGAEVSFARAAAPDRRPGRDHRQRPDDRAVRRGHRRGRPGSGSGRGRRDPRPRDRARCPRPEPVPDMLYVEVDGTGVPVRASETEGRTGKDDDGKAGTREVKLARLFTVSRLDDDGRPVMDPGSSTYVFTFDGKDALAGLVEAEYLRRGGEHFRQVVALGDGAAWIWTMAGKLYPHATHIVDIYHAREHLTTWPNHLAFITPDPAQWLARPQRRAGRREHRGDHRAPPAPTRSPASRPATWTRSSATSSTTPTGCATPTSRGSACSPAQAPSKAASRPSSSSAPSNPACTGPSKAPPTSSPCAASTPAAAGTSFGAPRPAPAAELRAAI